MTVNTLEKTFPNAAKLVLEKVLSHYTDIPFVPLDNRVVVSMPIKQDKTKGGIILPDALKDQQQSETVLAVILGVGCNAFYESEGKEQTPKFGDVVLVGQFSGVKRTYEEKEYRIVNDTDIQCIIPKKYAENFNPHTGEFIDGN